MKYLPWKSQTNILSEAKALQRRGTLVRDVRRTSSRDDARPDHREWSVCPQ